MQVLNEAERGLIKIINHFRKRAEKLIISGKIGVENKEVIIACNNLIEKLQLHAQNRESILNKRKQLQVIIKDNAICPACNKNEFLKLSGIEKNESGWKSNKYRCRKCNIEFTWNKPNNPWDLLSYLSEYKKVTNAKALIINNEKPDENLNFLLGQINQAIVTLSPVIKEADEEFQDLQIREAEISKLVKEFKSFLLIEKIKMDSIES